MRGNSLITYFYSLPRLSSRSSIVFLLLLCITTAITHAEDTERGDSEKAPKEYEPVSVEKAKEYLQQYGYITPASILTAGHGFKEDFEDVKTMLRAAIKKFQEFAGLEPTGELDNTTRKKMAQPRCGVNDVEKMRIMSEDDDSSFKWDKSRLTYSFHSFPTRSSLDRTTVRSAIQRAFETWLVAIPVDIVAVEDDDSSADINILFASGAHGDPWPFDGRGGVLAHATLPKGGLLHFDNAERWVYADADRLSHYGYTDLLAVAVHEIGHVLGLYHSRASRSIMAPFYREPLSRWGEYAVPRLDSSDIAAIQSLYGHRHLAYRPSPSRPNPRDRNHERERGENPPRDRQSSLPRIPTTNREVVWDDSAGEFVTVGGGSARGLPRTRSRLENEEGKGDWSLGKWLTSLFDSDSSSNNNGRMAKRDNGGENGHGGIVRTPRPGDGYRYENYVGNGAGTVGVHKQSFYTTLITGAVLIILLVLTLE